MAGGGCLYLIQSNESVAGGVGLGGDEDQARAGRFGLRSAAEGVQDANYGSIGGDNAESNRGNDGSEENHGHNQRIHGNQPLTKGCYQMHGPRIRIPSFFRFQQREPGKASQI